MKIYIIYDEFFSLHIIRQIYLVITEKLTRYKEINITLSQDTELDISRYM